MPARTSRRDVAIGIVLPASLFAVAIFTLAQSRIVQWVVEGSGMSLIGWTAFMAGAGLVTSRYLNGRYTSRSQSGGLNKRGIARASEENATVNALPLKSATPRPERYRGDRLTHNEARDNFDATSIALMCTESKERLKAEIAQLSRRGNVNLVLGVLTTTGAVAVLTFVALGNAPASQPVGGILVHYIPRLALAIFVEVFSFFFLRLYRDTLSEIKYFQNELTNVEARIIALAFSFITEDSTSRSSAVDILLRTERNFVLKVGDTTVDLERAKLEREGAKELMESAVDVVKALRGDKTGG